MAAEVRFPGEGAQIQGWISRPKGTGPYPAVLLLHGIGGPGEHYLKAAERYAGEGIVGVVFNWMAREQDPPDPVIVRDLEAAAEYLKNEAFIDAERVAVAGYCRGGTLATLALAQLSAFSAGVIFHGLLFYRDGTTDRRPTHPYDLADAIDAPLLLIHGASDTTAPIAEVYRFAQRLNELGKRFELKVYSGTEHAFTMPGGGRGGTRYHPENAEDAFRESVLFLRRVYGLAVGEVATQSEPVAEMQR